MLEMKEAFCRQGPRLITWSLLQSGAWVGRWGSRPGRGLGRQAHSGAWAEWWEARPLRLGLFVGVDAAPLALLIALCGACEAWRWAGHLVIQGHRDAPAASATRGPGLSGEAGPPRATVMSALAAPSRAAPPARGHSCPPNAPNLFFFPVTAFGERIFRCQAASP